MVSVHELIIIFLWLPQALGQLLNWTYWWQVKEYRLDRFRLFFIGLDGRKKLDTIFIAIKIILLAFSFLIYEFSWFALFIIFVLDVKYFILIAAKKIRKPVFTQRANKILGLSIFLSIAALFIGILLSHYSLGLLLGEIMLLFSPFLAIVWTLTIVNRVKLAEIEKAKQRLEKVKPTVIGITGSYGKTTTKDFIAHLLSSKFKVAKTKKSQNTEFGIARNIQSFVKKGTQVFVAELGAYKVGEIEKLAKIVSPDMGIITGIESQHLSLFGNFENIKKAKFEIIESLPKDGVAVFNISNKFCRQLANKAKKKGLKVLTCYRKKGEKDRSKADLVIEPILVNPKGVSFKVFHDKEEKELFAPVAGVHFLENIALAILVARYFQVSWKDIIASSSLLKTPENTMNVYQKDKAIIIDDSYNNTPHGFSAALDYLALYKDRKKIVVTPGIIELGKKSQEVHKELGIAMSNLVEKVILISANEKVALQEGMGNESDKLQLIQNPQKIISYLEKVLGKNYAILLEGRIPKAVHDYVQSQNV